jgi:rubredoxin
VLQSFYISNAFLSSVHYNRKENAMKKYVCEICGHVYDPEAGDPGAGIDPGTAFEDLPEDWVCPICGAPKSAFKPQD